jgi:hypothetical protein
VQLVATAEHPVAEVQAPEAWQVMELPVPVYPDAHDVVRVEVYVDEPELMV